MNKKQMLLGSLLCLLAVTAWGFMFPVMANALQFIDPFFFTTIRYGLAAIIFLILLLITEGAQSLRLEKRTLSLFFYGTVGFAGYGFLVFYGQQLAGPSGAIHAAMIQSLMPLIALLLQWITKNKRPQNYTFLCMLGALIGSIFQGYIVDKIEIAGASLTIIALLCNNVWQRKESIKIPTSVR
ncbi:DMT family transporter [Bacillus fungorum]|uniref:EamA family transporter n=1 Tax=Bacillus fungorum TaxID=2039284 RepID=UPI003390A8C6